MLAKNTPLCYWKEGGEEGVLTSGICYLQEFGTAARLAGTTVESGGDRNSLSHSYKYSVPRKKKSC